MVGGSSLKINIDRPSRIFADNLSNTENTKIIFSGSFGSGKTYFLNEFFKEHTEYNVVRISPVKYVVGQNEDIFEYIKMDLALDLIKNEELNHVLKVKYGEDFIVTVS